MDPTDWAAPDLWTVLAVLTNQVSVHALKDPPGLLHQFVANWAVEIVLHGLGCGQVGPLKALYRKTSFRKPSTKRGGEKFINFYKGEMKFIEEMVSK